ncbi:RNA-binding protein 43 [Hemicordylus capensis]|uniref:RNA-binding protein 43 n=1 Tax=Hemicordylus capensis TaxID=884348 RepID=UPI0023037105|nr:RNA-binding protein 43 [Hemicordylus capensis]
MATAQAAKAERTIVVYGVPDGGLNDDIMVDILMIHFQKAKNKGGDVEGIVYPTLTKGVAYVTFEDKQVAENVLVKGKHSLEDKRLHGEYPLKISLYGESVFTCVTCVLDLSLFGEKYILEDLVQELKTNLATLCFGPLHANGQITVQGPFSAIRTLQSKLLLKIKNSFSEQHAKRKIKAPDDRPDSRPAISPLSLESSRNFVPNANKEIRNNPVQSASKERLIVALDTDLYLYMKKFKGKLYQKSLEKCGVVSHEFVDGEITTIYLDHDNAKPGPKQLKGAKSIIEGLVAELQGSLRKETLPLCGSDKAEKLKREQACGTVRTQYPNVLVISHPTHIDIIGSSSDIYGFAQQVNKMVEGFKKGPWR